MSLNIRDRLYLQIMINGVEFPLDKLNTLQYLHIGESVRAYLPTLNLRLVDATKFIAQNNLLVDGAIIKITIGVQGRKKTYEFRRFNHKAIPGGEGGTQYHISAFLNVPLYWMASTPKAINGTASEAIKKIANDCGLNFYGVTTSESQLWMPYNTRYCEFARQVAERAWVDTESCVQLGVTADKTVRLINVSDFANRKALEVFSNKGNYASSFPVTDEQLLSKSGFFNSVGGYQDTTIQQSLIATTDQTVSQVNVKRNSRVLSMNKALKDSVPQAKVSFAPIDVGNVSTHYENALYQNRRLSNLFTFGVEFNTAHLVDSNLLDIALCELTMPEVSGMQDISGNFLITSKVTYIEGMNFYQKLECYRHGANSVRSSAEV
jgi:hypothetical protein